MDWKHFVVLGALISLSMASSARAQSADYFSGFYAGFEAGAFSYNTQITFDGVDDPAGRGGAGYGAFFGLNHAFEKLLVGTELSFHLASDPDPYTFDPAVVGFSELDLRRGASLGLDFRVGYLINGRFLLSGGIGYSANKQSVAIDGVPLNQFVGGAADQRFGALQFGATMEVAIRSKLRFRLSARSLSGHDLNAGDFGTIPTAASLTRFDVEPSQQQFLAGLMFRF